MDFEGEFGIPASRLSISTEGHSNIVCYNVIVRGVPRLAHIGGGGG